MSYDGTNVERRTALKAIGSLGFTTATTGLLGGTVSGSTSQRDPAVVRLRGSWSSPLSFKETQSKNAELIARAPAADNALLDDISVPEFDEDQRLVEYVARVDTEGRMTQYFGSTVKETEPKAHAKGGRKERSFQTNDVSATQTDITVGDDWEHVKSNEASSTTTYGDLLNNYDWYRYREGSDERNSFRSRVATTDDTAASYERSIDVTHNWGISELGNEAVYDAKPDSNPDTQEVSIGIPYTTLALNWELEDSTGGIIQNLSTSEPKIDWTTDIPSAGTSWFYPGSHVSSDRANCDNKQDVVRLYARGEYIAGSIVADVDHAWKISTVTC